MAHLDSQDTTVVTHDPLHGLPMAVFDLKASIASDGTLIMTHEDDDLDSLVAPIPGTASAAAPSPSPGDTPATAPAGTWNPDWTRPSDLGAAKALVVRVVAHVKSPSAAPWRVAFVPGGAKKDKSGLRYAAYASTTTASAFKDAWTSYVTANGAKSLSWRNDFLLLLSCLTFLPLNKRLRLHPVEEVVI